MPAAHIDAETVEDAFRASPVLLADYLTWPRANRRAVCRDVARKRSIRPKAPQYGAVAQRVNAPRRMSVRLSRRNHEARLAGVQQVMVTGERVPVSGRARRDVKRQQRAAFWQNQEA